VLVSISLAVLDSVVVGTSLAFSCSKVIFCFVSVNFVDNFLMVKIIVIDRVFAMRMILVVVMTSLQVNREHFC
jgi:hypothetical protein